MPKARFPIQQKTTTVSLAVIKDIVKTIIKRTFLPANTEIIIVNGQGGVRNIKNIMDRCNEERIRTAYNNFIFVSYTEVYDEEQHALLRAQKPINRFVFHDPEIGVIYHPEYAKVNVKLDLVVRNQSQSSLDAWQSRVKLSEQADGIAIQHDLAYDYSLPYVLNDALLLANQMKHGAAAPIEDYLSKWAGQGMTTRSNIPGTHKERIVREVAMSVLGMPDDVEFMSNKTSEDGIHQCTFGYTFSYNQIQGITAIFPTIINNQFIPKDLAEDWAPIRARLNDKVMYPKDHISELETINYSRYYLGDGGNRLINWDDWFPDRLSPDTQTVVLFPFQVDVDNPTGVCSLDDLPSDVLPDAVKRFLLHFHNLSGKYTESLVSIEHYRVGVTEEINRVLLSPDGVITTMDPCDPMQRNYIRISIFKDLARARPDHVAEVLNVPDIAFPLFQLYDKTLTKRTGERHPSELPDSVAVKIGTLYPSILHIPSDKYITILSFSLWIRKHKWTNLKWKRSPNRFITNVAELQLKARRL